MEKKYQIFISSTYKDLRNERQIIINTLLQMHCIPAGMEFFPSIDEEVFEHIKRMIDSSDYYLLITAGKYGSLSNDGLSFTEKEFDYALSKNKKIIALLHSDIESLPASKVELDVNMRNMLYKFRKKVSEGRLVKFWSDKKELSGIVSISLNQTFELYPNIGWVRSTLANDNIKECSRIGRYLDSVNIQIRTLHLICSSSNTYYEEVKQLVRRGVCCNNTEIFILFRVGKNIERYKDIKLKYNKNWEKIPIKNLHFMYVDDFEFFIRGAIINEKEGFIGFYRRVDDKTTVGASDKGFILTKETGGISEFLIKNFIDCFKNKTSFSSMNECVDDYIQKNEIKND